MTAYECVPLLVKEAGGGKLMSTVLAIDFAFLSKTWSRIENMPLRSQNTK
ncbi:MAG: hypothetical protein QXE92_03455 [Thermofilaceae archaeon]